MQIAPLVATAAFDLVEVRVAAVGTATEVVITVKEAMRTVPEAVTARVAVLTATPAAVDREISKRVDRRSRGKAAPGSAQHPQRRRIERQQGRPTPWWSSRGKDMSRPGPGTCCPVTGNRSYRGSGACRPWWPPQAPHMKYSSGRTAQYSRSTCSLDCSGRSSRSLVSPLASLSS